jgi:flagellar basal-body rod modification protein FlgD
MITPTSIHAAAAAPSGGTGTTPTSTGIPSAQGLDTMFLQLLVAQLQNQDPTSPLDPSQFVGQLAQFSELDQVTQINQLLEQFASSSGTFGSSSSSSQGGAPSPASAAASIPAAMNRPAPVSDAAPTANISSAATAALSAIHNMTSPTTFLNRQIQGVF